MISPCNNVEIDIHGQELITHGVAGFPMAAYQEDLRKSPVAWHWHEELEAGVVLRGTAIITVGSAKYEIPAGWGFFANSGSLHACRCKGRSSCQLHSVVFHPRLIGAIDTVFWQKYVQPVIEDKSLPGLLLDPSDSCHQQMIEAIRSSWDFCEQERPGYEFQVRSALSRLVILLGQQVSPLQSQPSEKVLRDSERMKEMLQYIQQHYGDELTVEQIAARGMVSESECIRCFHNTIGTTPIAYVKNYRLHRAAQLLSSTSLKISAIGEQCGFQEMSYFAKSFRQRYGYTPSQFRKLQLEEVQSVPELEDLEEVLPDLELAEPSTPTAT